jgi:hypothetical protein
VKKSNLMFWEKIAGLAGVKNPETRAAGVMKKWGHCIATPEASQKIIADLTDKSFPAHLTGADIGKASRLNPRVLCR